MDQKELKKVLAGFCVASYFRQMRFPLLKKNVLGISIHNRIDPQQ